VKKCGVRSAECGVECASEAVPMILLPAGKGLCPVCATKHVPIHAHNQQSLHYQYWFLGKVGRWPTWADAVAHCPENVRAFWADELKKRNAWSEPTEGGPVGFDAEGNEVGKCGVRSAECGVECASGAQTGLLEERNTNNKIGE